MRTTINQSDLSVRTRIMPKPLLFAATLVAVAAVLSGCGSRDRVATGSIPDDYRTRHPIVLTESEQTMDIPIATGDRELTVSMRDNIRGFASDHAAKSRGAMQIMVPVGSTNAATAHRLSKDIRATLIGAGRDAVETSSSGSNSSGEGGQEEQRTTP